MLQFAADSRRVNRKPSPSTRPAPGARAETQPAEARPVDIPDFARLGPPDILRLQRSVGNRVLAGLVQRSRQTGAAQPTPQSPPQPAALPISSLGNRPPAIQRVGQKKFGYELESNSNRLSEVAVLQGTFQMLVKRLRDQEKTKKNQAEHWLRTGRRDGPDTTMDSVPRDRLFGKNNYIEQLRDIGLTPERLTSNPSFSGLGFTYDKDTQKVFAGKHLIATLHSGEDAFVLMDPQPSGVQREVYRKRGKSPGDNNQYVKDDRGVFTRRYAYVEKSKYQVRSLLQTGSMTGQYQDKLVLGGKSGDKYQMDNSLRQQYQLPPRTGGLTPETMAFVHQEKGSGYQQRGLSLRSTPREVYGNQGESFRSKHGVAIRVDLAKVPSGQDKLLNHYSAGGLKDKANDLGRFKNFKTRRPYSTNEHYQDSVTKNRELYLETLTPDLIAGITYHRDTNNREDVPMEGETGPEQLKALAKETKFEEFRIGYDQGYKYAQSKDEKLKRDMRKGMHEWSAERKEGWNAGQNFYKGWSGYHQSKNIYNKGRTYNSNQGRSYNRRKNYNKKNQSSHNNPAPFEPQYLSKIESEEGWDYMVGLAYARKKEGQHYYAQKPAYTSLT